MRGALKNLFHRFFHSKLEAAGMTQSNKKKDGYDT